MKVIHQFLKRFGSARAANIDLPQRRTLAAVRPAPLLMALEPRVVYDASVAATASHPHAAAGDAHAGAATASDATTHAAPKTVAEHDVDRGKPGDAGGRSTDKAADKTGDKTADKAGNQSGNPAGTQAADQAGTPAADKTTDTQKTVQLVTAAVDVTPHAVVFIDPSVPNYQALIAGLPAGTQYVVLNATTDGFTQMADYLQTHQGVDSIHLISHGTDGQIQAGSTWLDAGDLAAHSGELTQIGAAMKPGGDFLIYGCDVAQKADGQMLVQQVAALTHLNVAASSDATGAAALGGNWALEYRVGSVHSDVIESAAAQQQYNALLGVTVETYDPHAAGMGDPLNGQTVMLDGVVYTTDGSASTQNGVYAVGNGPFGDPELSSGTGDGVLELNAGFTEMNQVTITLQNGATFSLSSFDLDAVTDGTLYLIPNHDASKEIVIHVGPHNGSGDAFTGTVDVSGNADFANLTSVTIVNANDVGFFAPTLDNLTYTVLSPTLTTSSGSAAFVAGDNTGSTPVQVDSGLTLTDPASTTMQSATITIANVKAGDSLSFTSNGSSFGDISAVYSNGVLTLTSSGGATVAQWQAALDSITFNNSAITPDATTRTINFSIKDGAGNTATATRNLTVTDTNQTPIVQTSGGSTSYVAGSTATVIDGGVTLSDRDNTLLDNATVTIGGSVGSGDTLSFTNTNPGLYGDIQGTYVPGTHTLTLTSASHTATDAQWQAAMDAVTFSSAAGTAGGARTISFAVKDGTKTSVAATRTVNVAPVPIVTTDSGSAAFIAGDNTTSTPVTVDAGLTVTEAGGSTLSTATVRITGNFQVGEDVLQFVNNPATMGDISGMYTAGTGVLELRSNSGTATLAQWQAALRSIQYFDSAITPNTATRVISFEVNDGARDSATVTRTVTVTATDQTPIVQTGGADAGYVAGSTATVIGGVTSVIDLDNTTLSSASVTIGGADSGDSLSFANTNTTLFGNIAKSYDPASHTLTLTSVGNTATDAQWQNALNAVTFSSTAGVAGGARTISFVVNDGVKASVAAMRTVNVAAVPVVTTDSGSAAFVAGDNATSTPVVVDSGLTVTEAGGSTLVTATVMITGNLHSAEDMLMFVSNPATMGDINGTYTAGSGVLELRSNSGTATLAQWQAALRAIQYFDSAITPNTAVRTISFTVSDGTHDSAAATRTVTVADTDQTPILSTTSGSSAFVAGDNVTSTPVVVDAGITVSDLDNTTLPSAHVAITGNFRAGEDILAFNNSSNALYGDINATYDPSTGVLTLTSGGAATIAQWQAALRAVTYTDTAITPNTANRTISFAVKDGSKDSNTGTKTVSVTATDQTPVISASSGDFDYLPGDAAHNIDSGITLSDLDSTTMSTLTVKFTSGFQSGDQLSLNFNAATMGSNFTVLYDATSGTFTVSRTGGMTLANWQAIIDSVQFSAASGVRLGTRTLSVGVSDGTKDSAALSYDVHVISSAPQLSTTSSGSAVFTAGDNTTATPVVVDGGISVSDPLGNPIATATVSITGGFHAGEDILGFTNDGATMGNITANYDAATGKLKLESVGGTASDAQWAAALRAVTYTDTAVTPDTTTRQISFEISDGTQTSTDLTRGVTVTAVDQTPILVTSGGDASFEAGDNTASTPVAIDTGLTLSDLDNATLASATVSITGGFHAGEDKLGFTNGDAAMFGNIAGSYDASTGVMTLSSAGGTATQAQWQAALRAVTYTDLAVTPDTTQRTISFTVSDGTNDSAAGSKLVDVASTDQSPVVTPTSGDGTFVSGDNAASAPIVIDNGITVSDLDNTALVSATVSITSGFHADQDILAFAGNAAKFGNITGSYDASTGVMTLTSAGGTATLAQWQAALQSITYTDTAITPDGATRTISFTVNDGAKDSAAGTRVIDLTATAQTPTLVTGDGAAPVFTASGADASPVVIDGAISITDRDPNAQLESAVVSISGNFQPGRDVLAFSGSAATGNISASYDASTGKLTLTSAGNTATLAQWQAALAAVTYADTAAETSGSSRTIDFAVQIGGKTSAAVSRTVTVDAGPPVIVAPPPPPPPAQPPEQSGQPTPATPITLPPQSPFMGGGSSLASPPPPHTISAPDTIPFFPLDLSEGISNPLIVIDAFAEAPEIGSIPAISTITFSTSDSGDFGGGDGWGGAGGPRAHGSLSNTSVDAQQSIPVPDQAPLSLDLPDLSVHLDVAPNQPFSVSLPVVIGGGDGLPVGADAHVELRLADGRPLPAWLRYDPVRGTLSGKLPPNQGELQIQIVVHDAAGHQTHREVKIDFGGQGANAERAPAHGAMLDVQPAVQAAFMAVRHNTAPVAKASLAEQFARAHATLHIARPTAAPVAAHVAGDRGNA